KIGVERSRQVLKESDLVLYVLNYNETLQEEDITMFETIRGLDYIVIINKTDLEQKLDVNHVRELAEDRPIITTSLIEEQGIDDLEEAIATIFFQGEIESSDLTYVSNARHIQLL